jgi:Lrp/AsnC family transcriptional regulator, leucine-responsive regulatory protein
MTVPSRENLHSFSREYHTSSLLSILLSHFLTGALAIVRLKSFVGQNCRQVISKVSEMPEVLEYYKVTGSDCVVIKVAAASIDHLESIIEQLSLYGPASTSIVFSQPMERRTITGALLDRAEGKGEQS